LQILSIRFTRCVVGYKGTDQQAQRKVRYPRLFQ